MRKNLLNSNSLLLNAHDEAFVINPELVIYMQADDHYTHVYYAADSHFMVPYGLGAMEERFQNCLQADNPFVRLGRKYIVNTDYLFRVNTMKEVVSLVDRQSNTIELHLAKPVVRNLIEMLKGKDEEVHENK